MESLTSAPRHKYFVNGHVPQGSPRPVLQQKCLVSSPMRQ